MLGERGGFIPRDVVRNLGLGKDNEEEEAANLRKIDFYRVVEVPLFYHSHFLHKLRRCLL